MSGYSTTFHYEGKEYPINILPHWRIKPPGETRERWLFQLVINHYFVANITKDPSGYWKPFEIAQYKNLPFELQAYDYELLGEMIEGNLPEFV